MAPGTLGMEAVDLGGTYSVTTYCSVAYKKFSVRWGVVHDNGDRPDQRGQLLRPPGAGVIRERLAGCPPPTTIRTKQPHHTAGCARLFGMRRISMFQKAKRSRHFKEHRGQPPFGGKMFLDLAEARRGIPSTGGGVRIRGGGPRLPDDAAARPRQANLHNARVAHPPV